MYDLRNGIIHLAEKSLHLFVEKRLRTLKLEDSWKDELASYVEKEYIVHPENMETIHSYLTNHSVMDLDINKLDITATIPLLLYYDKFKALYDEKSGFQKKTSDAFKSAFYDFRNIRNTIRHYTEEIYESQKSDFIMDQLDAICGIIRFALLCEKNCPEEETWKEILDNAFNMQRRLRGEKWFLLKKHKEKDIAPNEDISDLESEAETGSVQAQVLLGRMLYENGRYGVDKEKSFLWFLKAARREDRVAMYYLGLCYQFGIGAERDSKLAGKWIKKSADLGYAPAQYKIAENLWGREDITEKEKKELVYLFKCAADQEYPKALWAMGLCYSMGYGVEKDLVKSKELKEKAGRLGEWYACEKIADEARENKEYEKAIEWYKMAEKFGSRNVKHWIDVCEEFVNNE